MSLRGLALILVAIAAFAQTAPRFGDYPDVGKYNGRNAGLVLTKRDREFRTRLRAAAQSPPNFAGHYILTVWGCGAECLMGAAIDANTGRVSWIPHTLCCWGETAENFRPIDFELSSRLIVFHGERDERENDDGAHFYEFRDGKFVHIRSLPTPARSK